MILAQALRDEDRQDIVAEIGELLDIVDERQRRAFEAGFVQRNDAFRALLGRSDQREAAMTGGHAVADQRQEIMREGLGMGELQAHEIVDGAPVGMGAAEMLEIALGLLLAWPADDMRESEYLDITLLGHTIMIIMTIMIMIIMIIKIIMMIIIVMVIIIVIIIIIILIYTRIAFFSVNPYLQGWMQRKG